MHNSKDPDSHDTKDARDSQPPQSPPSPSSPKSHSAASSLWSKTVAQVYKEPKKPHENKTLYIGGLPIDMDEEEIAHAITQVVGIAPSSFTLKRNPPPLATSRGFGFITFESHDDAELARQKLSISFIKSVVPSVTWADSASAKSKEQRECSTGVSKSLFVKGLPKNADENKLQQVVEDFCPFKRISVLNICRNKSDGTSKGYGYITYSTVEDAQLVLSYYNAKMKESQNRQSLLSIDGSPITLVMAKPLAPSAVRASHRGKHTQYTQQQSSSLSSSSSSSSLSSSSSSSLMPAPPLPKMPQGFNYGDFLMCGMNPINPVMQNFGYFGLPGAAPPGDFSAAMAAAAAMNAYQQNYQMWCAYNASQQMLQQQQQQNQNQSQNQNQMGLQQPQQQQQQKRQINGGMNQSSNHGNGGGSVSYSHPQSSKGKRYTPY